MKTCTEFFLMAPKLSNNPEKRIFPDLFSASTVAHAPPPPKPFPSKQSKCNFNNIKQNLSLPGFKPL